ncbi:hypothetical protein J3R83DRAFT_112 [Lanmaoa asiatica]|nr:hypothetical protein J3R83DRAFT_112 [Lanmaoa asiatica]
MAPYRNIGWPFYLKMVELGPDGVGATGAYAHAPGDEEVFDDDELQLPSSPGCYSMPEEPGSSNVSQPILNPANCDIDLNDLLQLGRDIVSPNPTTQNAALHSALSILNRVSSPPASYTNPFSSSDSRVLSFSDMSGIRPPSSHTSLVSSGKISKPKLRARTPAASAGTSSLSSSAAVSRRSKSTHSRASMANTAAMTGMTYAINRAVNCIEEMQTLFTSLSSSPSPHVATPSLLTFPSTPSRQSLPVHRASRMYDAHE